MDWWSPVIDSGIGSFFDAPRFADWAAARDETATLRSDVRSACVGCVKAPPAY